MDYVTTGCCVLVSEFGQYQEGEPKAYERTHVPYVHVKQTCTTDASLSCALIRLRTCARSVPIASREFVCRAIWSPAADCIVVGNMKRKV
jgi:hypothetical protein